MHLPVFFEGVDGDPSFVASLARLEFEAERAMQSARELRRYVIQKFGKRV
jgi:hypothetical protein